MTLENHVPAIYANYFRIGHNANEFILECCQAYDGGEEISLAQRVVFTPTSARELHVLLGNSLIQHARLIASFNDGAQ